MIKGKTMQTRPWTKKELDIVKKWFSNKSSKKVLYERIYSLNPNRSFEAICRKIRTLKSEGYEKTNHDHLSTLRVGYLDIETTGLRADWGYILTWCIKPRGVKTIIHSSITKQEVTKYVNDGKKEIDYRVVCELLDALDKFDVLWTHYGADWRFDLPYIRTRALINGILDKFPDRDEKFIRDTWPIARTKLRLSNNRLVTIAEACGITSVEKTKIDKKYWRLGAFGNKKALEYILDHNVKDVQVLEKVHIALESLQPVALKTF